MVVQHNLTAMNSNRMLGVTTATQAKSTEKLSSGYKINRAADDAAGLSISEKMRKQIRGLTQASSNAQDGISAVQTAEGALTEVHDMLQRMNELAVKSSNGTNSADDRTYIQNEIDQLVTEIDRVAETTKFNETYLLKGDKSSTEKTYAFSYVGGAGAGTTTYKVADTKTLYDANGTKFAAGATLTEGTTYYTAKSGNTEATKDNAGSILSVDGAGAITYAGTTRLYDTDGVEIEEANLSTYFDSSANTLGTAKSDKSYTDIKGSGTEITDITATNENIAATTTPASGTDTFSYYDKDGNKIAANALSNYLNYDGTDITQKSGTTLYDKKGAEVTLEAGKIGTPTEVTSALTVKLHVGADATANNQISVKLDAMSAKNLGVSGLKVDGADDTNALGAIDTIKEAIQKVSTQRSALGAAQNRLEHTINNLDNVVENTTSAEASIRDTDMATEMVKYSNNNILAQAGQSMLAQANQSNQGVLSLLQ